MERILEMLESLPETEMVQGVSAKEAAARLRVSMQVRARILAEQAIFRGEGGGLRYDPWSDRRIG